MSDLQKFVSSLSSGQKLYGGEDHSCNLKELKAGSLSMVYDNGALRRICIGRYEIIRMMYSAVRDKEWLTVNPVISDEEFDIRPDSFRISYSCRYTTGEIYFTALYIIEGNSDNSIIFSFEGKALKTFEKTRIGICILHPIEGCAGNKCLIVHANDEAEESEFPVNISPCQPFMDIRSMKWQAAGNKCIIDFFGEIFETEDQRNWTDASYKTYCTPLELPFPVTVKKGDRFCQRIEMKVEGNIIKQKEEDDIVNISISRDKITELPDLGIGHSTRPEPLTVNELNILKKLRFDHYRVDIYLFDSDWRNRAATALDEAEKLEYPLELALFFSDDAVNQCAQLIDWLALQHTNISVIILYHKTEPSTPDVLTDAIAPLIRAALPGIRIACGTNASFARLNSNRPGSVYNDLICYSIHPQEHASDNMTLIENLKGQEYTVWSAKQFSEGKGIWISPVNMQRRFNSNVANYETRYNANDLPPQVDSRIMSLTGACWTTGSLKYLCESGAEGITYYETAGERGIIQGDFPSRWPHKFLSVSNMIFPVFYVFDFLFENKHLQVVKSSSSQPLKVDSLILSNGKETRMILINFTSSEQKVRAGFNRHVLIISQLNEKTYRDAVSCFKRPAKNETIKSGDPLLLQPFSITFIDCIPEDDI